MSVVSMKQLLEAGVHFGHQTRRWNPKMSKYIFTQRNGIHIIDLQKTVRKLDEAYNFIKEITEEGKSVLFVGTKKQAQESVKDEAIRSGSYYVNARWLGSQTSQPSAKELTDLTNSKLWNKTELLSFFLKKKLLISAMKSKNSKNSLAALKI